MNPQIFSGCIPALLTPCRPDRTPDFDALVKKGTELIAAGMSAVVYCGSMGDWPLLTDAQRMEGVERLVKAGIPVIVGARRADGGTHFVVVKGFLGGDSLTASGFAINDPGSGSRTTLQQFLSAYPTVFRRAYYTK